MQEIKLLRKRIDEVDEQILQFLSERAEICRSIGLIKEKNGLPIEDVPRENYVYANVRRKAIELNLSPYHMEAVYRQIINMCSAVQDSKRKRNETELED
jgi:chorismate mutase